MATLTDVRTGLKNRLATINGVRAYAYEPPNPQPPAMYVGGPMSGTTYDTDFDGDTLWALIIGIFVTPADLTRAQSAIDAYLDPRSSSSIRAAVMADQTLGGTVSYARVVGVEESPRLVGQAGSQLLYASVRVEARSL